MFLISLKIQSNWSAIVYYFKLHIIPCDALTVCIRKMLIPIEMSNSQKSSFIVFLPESSIDWLSTAQFSIPFTLIAFNLTYTFVFRPNAQKGDYDIFCALLPASVGHSFILLNWNSFSQELRRYLHYLNFQTTSEDRNCSSKHIL